MIKLATDLVPGDFLFIPDIDGGCFEEVKSVVKDTSFLVVVNGEIVFRATDYVEVRQ